MYKDIVWTPILILPISQAAGDVILVDIIIHFQIRQIQ